MDADEEDELEEVELADEHDDHVQRQESPTEQVTTTESNDWPAAL